MNNEEYCIGMYDKEEVDKMFQEMLKAEYREDGRIEGMKEGKRKGLKEGRKEGKIEIIKTMLQNNLEVSFIEKMTNIPFKEILKLKEKL